MSNNVIQFPPASNPEQTAAALALRNTIEANAPGMHAQVVASAATRLFAMRQRLDAMFAIAKPYFGNNDDEGLFAVEMADLLQHLRQVEADLAELADYVRPAASVEAVG